MPIASLLSLNTSEKNVYHLYSPRLVLIHIDKIPLILLCFWINSLSFLSLSLYNRCSKPLIAFTALQRTCSSESITLVLGSPALDTTCRCVLPVVSRGEEPPPSTCWQYPIYCSPGPLCCNGKFLCPCVHHGPHSSTVQSCFPAGWHPAYPGAWGCSLADAGLSISVY